MKKKPMNHYVDNERFLKEIIQYKEKCIEAAEKGLDKPRMPEYVGECIYKIAIGLSSTQRFINYSPPWKEEMVSDAIENCILYFDRFDPNVGQNPFAYFTQISYFAFRRRCHKEERNRYTIYKSWQMKDCGDEFIDSDENSLTGPAMYDNINQFIANFEAREEEKKRKRKEAKKGLEKFLEKSGDK